MPRGKDLSHLVVHRALYERADRRECVTINQGELAVEFGVNKFTMSRTINKMVDDGRLQQITRNKHRFGIFKVSNPDDWVALNDDDEDEFWGDEE